MKILFTKKLTKTDVGTRLSIPTRMLLHFPAFRHGCYSAELRVKDECGKLWNMRCTIRRQKHKKPVMSAGWKPFVRHMNLEVDDIVTFYRVKDEGEGDEYRIKVQKAKKVFGGIIGYTPLAHGIVN